MTSPRPDTYTHHINKYSPVLSSLDCTPFLSGHSSHDVRPCYIIMEDDSIQAITIGKCSKFHSWLRHPVFQSQSHIRLFLKHFIVDACNAEPFGSESGFARTKMSLDLLDIFAEVQGFELYKQVSK